MKPEEIGLLLPGIFQRTLHPGNPLWGLLDVMDSLYSIPEETLAHLEDFFNPYRTPDRFVPFLADWVDLEWLLVQTPGERSRTGAQPLPSGLGRLRELIAASISLSQSRGTAYGLIRFLEIATGHQGFTIHENYSHASDEARPFHLSIEAPAESSVYRVLIERIIAYQKPVYDTFELYFKENEPGGSVSPADK